MSSPEEAPRLGESVRCLAPLFPNDRSRIFVNGKVHGSEMQAVAPRGNRPVPEERCEAPRIEVQARGAAGRCQERAEAASLGVRVAAAREAEAAPHVRRPRAPVSQLLSEGR